MDEVGGGWGAEGSQPQAPALQASRLPPNLTHTATQEFEGGAAGAPPTRPPTHLLAPPRLMTVKKRISMAPGAGAPAGGAPAGSARASSLVSATKHGHANSLLFCCCVLSGMGEASPSIPP